MKSIKLTLLIITIFGLFFIQAPQVFAAGGPASAGPCCIVKNPGNGALALKGTLALVYDPDTSENNVDITLRLDRSGNVGFFRLNFHSNLTGLTDNDILCLIFNPNETADPAIQPFVNDFVKEILNFFFPGMTPDDTRLVLTKFGASDYQNNIDCDTGLGADNPCLIGDTGRVSTLGDVTIYAVETTRVQLPEGCQ